MHNAAIQQNIQTYVKMDGQRYTNDMPGWKLIIINELEVARRHGSRSEF